jgi:hypothetical protein
MSYSEPSSACSNHNSFSQFFLGAGTVTWLRNGQPSEFPRRGLRLRMNDAAAPCLHGVNVDNCTSSSFVSALIFKWILKVVTKQIRASVSLVALAPGDFLMSVIT